MEKSKGILRFKCKVEDVIGTLIPSVNQAKMACKGKDKEVYMYLDLLQHLYMLEPNSEVRVEISRSKPRYRGEEFVARGKVFSIGKENGYDKYLISMGGIILRILSSKPLDFKMLEEVYVKVVKS